MTEQADERGSKNSPPVCVVIVSPGIRKVLQNEIRTIQAMHETGSICLAIRDAALPSNPENR